MTLEESWKESCWLWREGWEMIQRAQSDFKEAAAVPVSHSRVDFWYHVSEMCVEAMGRQLDGYKIRLRGDLLWHAAVMGAKGNIKMHWESVGEKGFKCTLETGEVFEP